MFTVLANPARFMSFSRWLAPLLGAAAALCIAVGLWLGLAAPDDYQQASTLKIMFVHVPAAWLSMFAYMCLAGASFFGLVFRHSLADAAARRPPPWAPASPSWPWPRAPCGAAPCGAPGGCGMRA